MEPLNLKFTYKIIQWTKNQQNERPLKIAEKRVLRMATEPFAFKRKTTRKSVIIAVKVNLKPETTD